MSRIKFRFPREDRFAQKRGFGFAPPFLAARIPSAGAIQLLDATLVRKKRAEDA